MMGVNQVRAWNRNYGTSHDYMRPAGEDRRNQHRPQAGYFPTDRLGLDPWFYAPLSGSCYHLERNCGGLRNSRAIKIACSLYEKRKILTLLHLRPCRICIQSVNREQGNAASDPSEVPLREVD